MTPEERLDRLESVAKMLVISGRKARSEWRVESRAQAEKINILIHSQMETTEQIKGLGEQIRGLAVAQAELTKSQKLTDRTLRAFINSLRKGGNGNSSS